VVEGEASLCSDGVDRFSGRELNLFDEVFVGGLGKAFAFFLVEVDVVYPERSIKSGLGGPCKGRATTVLRYGKVLELSEFECDADFVVLEGNERDTETIVSAVEELKRYVEYVFIVGGGKFSVGSYVTYHASIATFVASLVGKFVPDVEPVTILFVDLGATNFEVVIVNEGVAYIGYPGPFGGTRGNTFSEGGTEVHFSYYIGIAG
jgi:hypothetical protein